MELARVPLGRVRIRRQQINFDHSRPPNVTSQRNGSHLGHESWGRRSDCSLDDVSVTASENTCIPAVSGLAG